MVTDDEVLDFAVKLDTVGVSEEEKHAFRVAADAPGSEFRGMSLVDIVGVVQSRVDPQLRNVSSRRLYW